MKTKIKALALIALFMPIVMMAPLMLAPGCATTAPTISTNLVRDITQLAAYTTAKSLLLSNPQTLPQLQHANAGFCELVQAQTWDITTAAAIASANGLGLLSSSEGTVALTGVVMLTDLITGQTIDLKSSPYAQAVIVGACNGLTLALTPVIPPGRVSTLSAQDPTLSKLTAQVHSSRGKVK